MRGASSTTTLRDEAWLDATSDGTSYRVAHIFRPDEGPGGQMFLVRFAASSGGVTRTHFHSVAQFQLVVSGRGRIGRHHVEPGFLHYVDPFTPYGPILDEDGLAYLTIRAEPDLGGRYMPDSRDALRDGRVDGGPHRQITASVDLRLDRADSSEPVITPHDDGLAATVVRAAPNATAVVDDDPRRTNAPRHLIVLAGSVRSGVAVLPELSAIHTTMGAEPLQLIAADSGASVLILDYPDPPARNRASKVID